MVEGAGFRQPTAVSAGVGGHRLYYLKSVAHRPHRSSRGARCWTPGARTGGSCGEAREGTGPRAGSCERARRSCTRDAARRRSQRMGIERLYSHQAQALHAAWAGPTIVTTGHRLGQVAVLQPARRSTSSAATRARGRSTSTRRRRSPRTRRARSRAFGLTKRVRPAIYDGDTPREARAQIRRSANIVLTNPDMLHVGILPNHAAWAELFANLAVVVVDEAHVYRGVFGSHVANVLRRLRRIAAAYGTEPRFLLASATIANPVELAERLTGLEDVAPDRRRRLAGAAAADRDVEPAADRRGARRAPLGARRGGGAARAARRATGARTICFMKSRKGVEVLSRLVEQRPARTSDPELAELVAPYRAGYTPQQRRELEGRLTRGELRAVITTDALELGIDVGELDAAVVVTFPGTVASLRQMWGRAGRRRRRARPGGLRRRRGRARPVLLPPPRRLPRAPRRGGDPRPREPR